MKRILLLIALFAAALTLNAQLVSIEVETVAVHDFDNPDLTDLAGMTTYRIYANLTNETDFVSACAGLSSFPLQINTSTQFYQNEVGSSTEPNQSLIGTGLFDELLYDSYVTIGRETNASPGAPTTTLQGVPPWANIFEDYQPDNAGHSNNILISDDIGGGWFSTDPDQSLAGADLRVLLGQFTTDGVISGVLNVQVFIEWVQGTPNNVQESQGFPFTSDESQVFGCMDDTAINFNDLATLDDGSCIYPCGISIDEVTTEMISCGGLSNGSAEIVVSGQQGFALFSLNGAGTTANSSFNNLSAGDYSVVITDDQECTAETTFTISEPEELTVTAILTEPISCNGATDAEITVSSTGGTGAIMFDLDPTFSNPSMETILSEIGPGDYTVYAIDENDCESSSNQINLANPGPIVGGILNTFPETCEDFGLIQAAAAGGTPPYQYSIDGGSTWNNSNLLDVVSGEYTLDILDASGCVAVAVDTETVGGPEPIVITATALDISCNGAEDGELSVTAEGGNEGYTIEFNGATSTESEWMNLASGDYMVTMTDADGCTGEIMVTINEPEEIMITVDEVVLSTGDNGSISITAIGGTGGLDYEWTGPDNFTSSGEEDLTGLAAGTYTVNVTDENECFVSEIIEVEALVDINPLGNNITIQVYPNPNNGVFTLNFHGLNGEDVFVNIIDAQGRIIEDRKINAAGSYSEIIDMTNVSSGMYFMGFVSNGYRTTQKILKQ